MKYITLYCTLLICILYTTLSYALLINFNTSTDIDTLYHGFIWSDTNIENNALFIDDGVLLVGNDDNYTWLGATFIGDPGTEVTVIGYKDGEVVFTDTFDITCDSYIYRSNIVIDNLKFSADSSFSVDNFRYKDDNCTGIMCDCKGIVTNPNEPPDCNYCGDGGSCDGDNGNTPVPEPCTMTLIGIGLIVIGLIARRYNPNCQ